MGLLNTKELNKNIPYFVQYSQGNKLYFQGNYDAALIIYKKIINKNKHHFLYNDIGLASISIGNIQQGLIYLKQGWKISPNSSMGVTNYAYGLMNVAQYKTAQILLRKAIKLDDKNPYAYSNLGNLLNSLSKFQQATNILKQSLNIQITYSALNDLGFALCQLQKEEQGLQIYRKVLTLNPTNDQGYNQMGIALNALGNYQAALLNYNIGLKINPKGYQIYRNKGQTLMNLKRYSEALQNLNKSIQINPKHDRSFLLLGILHDKLGNFQEALYFYNQTLLRNFNCNQAEIKKNILIQEVSNRNPNHKEQKFANRQNYLCIICCQKNVNTVSGKCGHMILCFQCSFSVIKCPVCRDLMKPIRVYQ